MKMEKVLSFFLPFAFASSAFASERSVGPVVLTQNWFVNFALLFGSVFILAAGLGMLRFPDAYARAHASSKLVTLGGASVFIGAGVAFAPTGLGLRLVLIAAFFLLTAPLASYMITRAGYLRGVEPFQEPGSEDEWGALGEGASDTE